MSDMSPPESTGLYFDDVHMGSAWTTPGFQVDEDDIIRFAREWDPHPFHIDKEAAKTSVFGDLCASGLQTLMLSYRAFTGLKVFEGTTLAGLGLDQLKFNAPVFAGDRLHVRITVEEATPTSKPDRGLLKLRLATYNEAGVLLSDFLLPALVRRRTATPQSGYSHDTAV